jgi:hypothetical protein
LGLSLRQAEEGGEFAYTGGFEAWDGGTSYSLGGRGTATETADGETGATDEPAAEAEVQEEGPVEPHVDDTRVEPADTVHTLPADQPEGTTEPAANGTARVPER